MMRSILGALEVDSASQAEQEIPSTPRSYATPHIEEAFDKIRPEFLPSKKIFLRL